MLHITLDLHLIVLSVKQGGIKYHFFESLVFLNLGLNPGRADHWRTLYSLVHIGMHKKTCNNVQIIHIWWEHLILYNSKSYFKTGRSTKRFIFFWIYLFCSYIRVIYVYVLHTCYICVCFQLVAFIRERIWHNALLMGYSRRLELTLVCNLNIFPYNRKLYIFTSVTWSYNCFSRIIINYLKPYTLVCWGCRIYRLHLCGRVRLPQRVSWIRY